MRKRRRPVELAAAKLSQRTLKELGRSKLTEATGGLSSNGGGNFPQGWSGQNNLT